MATVTNSKIEQYYFELFRSDFELPAGHIKYHDKPDVLIQVEATGQTVGIEITNFYLQDGAAITSEQRQRPLREKVVRIAQQLYANTGGRKIELSVDFSPLHAISDCKKLAVALADFAKAISGKVQGYTNYSPSAEIPELRWIYHNGNEYQDAKWSVMQSFEGVQLCPARLREIVAIKDELAKNYCRTDCLWLLLIVDFMDLAQDQELVWPLGESLKSSAFDRIIIYKPQFRQLLEIKIDSV